MLLPVSSLSQSGYGFAWNETKDAIVAVPLAGALEVTNADRLGKVGGSGNNIIDSKIEDSVTGDVLDIQANTDLPGVDSLPDQDVTISTAGAAD